MLWPHLAQELERIASLIDNAVHDTDVPAVPPERSADSRLTQLATAFALDDLDLDLLLLALAPEADRRYHASMAYLNGEHDYVWPTPASAHQVLSRGVSEPTLAHIWTRLASDGALARSGLIQVVPTMARVPALTAPYALPSPLVHYLLQIDRLPPDLVACAERDSGRCIWADLQLDGDREVVLRRIPPLLCAREAPARPAVLLVDADPVLARRVARALASELGRDLLAVDTSRIAESARSLTLQLRLVPDTVYLHGCTAHTAATVSELLDAWKAHGFGTIIGCDSPRLAQELARHVRSVAVELTGTGVRVRDRAWDSALASEQVYLGQEDRAVLADRFDIVSPQMRRAVQSAVDRHALAGSHPGDLLPSIVEETRRLIEARIVPFATKVSVPTTWSDLVLPAASFTRLREFAAAIRHRHLVYHEWELGRRGGVGVGLKALFAGPPGTGKTITAAAIANDLRFDLYRVDLSGVVSKYIGETEKHLDDIFASAKGGHAILFFDEADALFGKRSEVKDAHDRYANIEVAYLLQKLDEHDGVVILATNLKKNIDDAFARRLQYLIEFPTPDAVARERLWRGMFSGPVPVDEDVDWSFLAKQFTLSGGDIRNVALDAAFLAADDGRIVTMQHLVRAVGRQVARRGRLPSASEFQQFHGFVASDCAGRG